MENFWKHIYSIAGLLIALLILIIGGCTMNTNRLISEMVKSGVDPLKARCAVTNSDKNEVCIIMATK